MIRDDPAEASSAQTVAFALSATMRVVCTVRAPFGSGTTDGAHFRAQLAFCTQSVQDEKENDERRRSL